MKKIILLLAATVVTVMLFAQAPQKLSYQAVIRNASNVLVANTTVGMRISILQGSATGAAVYVETQTPSTNTNGLASIEIGSGSVVTGTFATINWATGLYWIKTETDPAGGTVYSIIGTSQLLSVPFALHAASASGTGWVTNGNNINNTNSGNVGIGTATPAATAQLDVSSTTKGFLPPRMTEAQRNAILNPAAGLMIFCTNCGLYGEWQGYNGTSWTNMLGSAVLPASSVTICNQTWMTKNLDVDHYRNGDPIPQVTDPTAWFGLTTGAWCYYNNDPANGPIYGKLYNWYAVNDPRGLAPTGWHIPTETEWTILQNSCIELTNPGNAGGAMKETGTIEASNGLWHAPNAGATNSSGFTGIPGGYREGDGRFIFLGYVGYWWSSSQNTTTIARGRFLDTYNGLIGVANYSKQVGFSVRCLRDVAIGDNYQGGIVAYILQPGDPGYDAGVQHGLIAAPTDQSTAIPWGCALTLIAGADGIALGTGNQNTIDIMAGCGEAGIAARICGDLVSGGYSDWYLPSKDELNKLYINRLAIGGFNNGGYWSSTEYSNNFHVAWYQHFSDGIQEWLTKYYPVNVRAVRSF